MRIQLGTLLIVVLCVVANLQQSVNGAKNVKQAKQSIADTPFLQDSSIIATYNGEPIANWPQLPLTKASQILQVESTLVGDLYLILSNSSLSFLSPGLNVTATDIPVTYGSRVKAISAGTFLVATPTSLSFCNFSPSLSLSLSLSSPVCKVLTESASFGIVRAIDVAFNTYWIGSDKGLFTMDPSTLSLSQVSFVTDPISSLSHSFDNGQLAAGSAIKLYMFNGTGWRYDWVGYIIDGPITSLSYDNFNTLWIGNEWSINQRYENGSFNRISGPTGLPYGNITYLNFQSSTNSMWVGTLKGAMRYNAGQWKYYFGPRWIWGEAVLSIASAVSTYSTIVIVDGGVSNITFEYWTLSAKAAYYQNMVQSPSHLRSGLAGQCSFPNFGISEGCTQTPSDNDGLWTSMYLASQSYRYAVTKEEEARENAWTSFEAMEMLSKVTGQIGLPARSFQKDSGPLNGDWWLNSTVFPGMMWKGNTSSDELVGHFFVYPLFHDLVCQTDEERERPMELLYNITNYIVENDFYLLQDGIPTRWGVWNPTVINGNYYWGDGRGLNSLQILAWIANAYVYTGDEKFMTAFNYLVDEADYGTNLINTKVTIPNDLNYSDDELMFLAYYTFFYAGGNKFLKEQFEVSLNRTWTISKPVKSSLWNTIYGAYNDEADFNINDIIECLQNWPLSQIDWPASNSQRLDYTLNLEANIMGGTSDSLSLLPWDERSFFVWNGDPFRLDEGSGFTEAIPTGWLLPYWMARYHGFISE